MTALLVLAWTFFAVGAISAWAFVGLYLVDVRPWRRRNGEDPSVRRVRWMILSWSSGLSLLYLSALIGTLTLRTHPSVDAGRLALSATVAGLAVNQLITYLIVKRRSA